jgi:hypothetical protein
MKRFFGMVLAIAIIFGMCGMGHAAMITFTHAGNGSGQVGSSIFSGVDFIITATGDTNNVQSDGDVYSLDHTSASIYIDTIGTYSFTSGTRTFVYNGGSVVGFSREGMDGSDLFDGPADPVLHTWNMQSGIGPVSGTGELIQWESGDVETTGGVLIFSEGTCDAIFQASMNPVPLPPSLLLLAPGFLGLAGLRKRFSK